MELVEDDEDREAENTHVFESASADSADSAAWACQFWIFLVVLNLPALAQCLGPCVLPFLSCALLHEFLLCVLRWLLALDYGQWPGLEEQSQAFELRFNANDTAKSKARPGPWP